MIWMKLVMMVATMRRKRLAMMVDTFLGIVYDVKDDAGNEKQDQEEKIDNDEDHKYDDCDILNQDDYDNNVTMYPLTPTNW